MNKNKKYYCGLLVVAVIAFFSLTFVNASDNFVRVSLPKRVSIELPKDWVVLSQDQRITIETMIESRLDLAGLDHENSDSTFTAKYYKNDNAVGIFQIKYHPNYALTQKTSRQATPQFINEWDAALKENIAKSVEDSGIPILSWEGTKKITINGITAFLVENHRKAKNDTGVFRMRLVCVFAGKRTIQLAVSYREEEQSLLEPITDRIINSLRISNINETPFSSVLGILSAWEVLLVLITMYFLSASVIFGDLRTEDLGRKPLWANNPSGGTIFLFYLLWPLWILVYSSSLLYGSWRLKWEKLYKLLVWLLGISYAGVAVAMAVGITAAVTRWFGDIGWFRMPVFFLGIFLIYKIMGIFRPRNEMI